MSIRGLDRPLSLGEILDRAVTLSVQNFPMLLLLVAVVAVPLAIVQSFSINPLEQYLAAIRASMHGSPAEMTKILAHLPAARPFDYALIALALLTAPLITGAVTIAVSRLLAAEPVTVASAYLPALRRFPSVIGSLIVWLAIAFAGLLLVSIVLALVLVLLFKGKSLAQGPAIGGAIAIFGGTFLVTVPVFAVGYVLASLTASAIFLESGNPFVAIGRTFARIFARREFLRSIVIAFALFAISFVISLVGALLGGLAFSLTKWYPSYIVIAQLVNAVGTIFGLTILTVYYFDVRIRREGSDLLAPLPVRSLSVT